MGFISDLPLVLFCLTLTHLWTLIAIPWIVPWTKSYLFDGGWGVATTIGWVVTASCIWFLAHLGLPINSQTGVYIVTLVLLIVAIWKLKQNKSEIVDFIKKRRSVIITEEILYAFGFLLMIFIRGYKPDILDLEKFMDAGFINVYLHTTTLPAPDMWLAGYNINYYTFGHFIGAIASHTWSLPVTISYNVILGLLLGLLLKSTAGLIFSLVSWTTNKVSLPKSILTAILGAGLVGLGGNSHKAWSILKNNSWENYWYPDATRFIKNTIHEFPAYSFVVSDLHAHVFSLPLTIALITILYIWFQTLKPSSSISFFFSSPSFWASLVSGVGLGLVASTSTWDTLIYGLFLIVVSIVLLSTNIRYFYALLYSAILMGFAALFSASPWWLHFESISEGARWVTERSELWRFLVLWTSHGVVTITAMIVAIWMIIKHTPKHKNILSFIPFFRADHTQQIRTTIFILGLGLTALVLLLLPEVFYMKDIYPDHPRANTMFKLTFQSFVQMGIVAGWLLGITLHYQLKHKSTTAICLFTVSVLIGVASIYPYGAFKSYYGFSEYKGLDGLGWLEQQHPDDFAAIEWLNATQPDYNRPVILEAVGESYTTFARVSTFTAMPTVLGWRVHEWLWRGSFDIPGQRTGEVDTIYTQPNSPSATTLLSQYQVSYIFVGDKEREAYSGIDEAGLKRLGSVVFSSGDTYIIKL